MERNTGTFIYILFLHRNAAWKLDALVVEETTERRRAAAVDTINNANNL